MKTIFNLLAVCGFFCAATNVGATTITYDFVGSGSGSHASGFTSYTYNFATGAETFSDHFDERGNASIHSIFTIDVNNYQDSDPADNSSIFDTYNTPWLTSYSTANSGVHNNTQTTSGIYRSLYDYTGCELPFCTIGILSIFGEGTGNASATYYDSGVIKSLSYDYSYNQVGISSNEMLLSKINGKELVTSIGDFSEYPTFISQLFYSITINYDESGSPIFQTYDGFDYRTPITSVTISVNTADVPEPTPLLLLGLGLLMVSARRFARK